MPDIHEYHSLIARAVAGLGGGTPDIRKDLYERARASQVKNIDPARFPSAITREREALELAIHAVEAEAAASDAERAENDAKIVFAFSDFCEETTTRPDCFYDESVLPHPKEAIISAIEREIVRSPLKAHVDWLQSARLFLWNFLTGVGDEPVSFKGTSQLPRGDTPADREALRRIVASPEYQQDLERSSHLMSIAEKQGEEVKERIDNALRIRSIRLARLEPAALDEQGSKAPTS
jgi:hypothetical protein